MKHMNPKLARLLYEGFSMRTLENLDNNQISALYSRIVEQATGVLNIPQTDTAAIAKAKTEKKPFVTYEEEMEEGEMTEKSVSKSQQGLMGAAYSVKSGKKKLKDIDIKYRNKVKELTKMTKKDLKDFASTKHKNLPDSVDEISAIEESILQILDKYLPPHTTKGELIRMVNRVKL